MYRSNVHNWINQLKPLHVLFILVVLGLVTYFNAINHPFVHDDVVFIQLNPHISELNLKDILIQTSEDDHLSLVNKYYRPFLELINRILYRIFGLNPHGFHFFNILLHVVNSFLVYKIIHFIIHHKGMALATAVLFLIHPVQNEAVACISGISNLIFTFFCLMSFYAYFISMHSTRGGKSLSLYGISLILFLFALLSKEQSVVLPLLIVLYELCFTSEHSKEDIKKDWVAIGGFFGVLSGYFVLRKMLFGFALLKPADNQGELWFRILAIPRSLLTYLGVIFSPHDLHYYRSQDILLPFFWPLIILLLSILIVGLIIYRTPRPQKIWLIFGLAWFMISLGPTLNIVPLINEYSKIMTAEHFLYLPLVGIILFTLSAGHYWIGKFWKKSIPLGILGIGIISILFIGINIKQNMYWRGEVPLFEHTLRYQPEFGRVRALLARAYSNEGRYEDAVREAQKALAIMSGYEQKVPREDVKEFYRSFIKGIYYHLGYCFDMLGKDREALAAFQNALRFDPENGDIHYSLGLSYLKVKDVPKAITHFEKSLALEGRNLLTMNNLAICYQEVGQYAKAEELLKTIAEKDSQSVSAEENLKNFLKKKESGVFGAL